MEFIKEYWMPFLYWIFLGIVTYLIKRVKDYRTILFATQSGIKSLLRSEIVEFYNKFKHYHNITLAQKDNIENLYKEYKNNGGNGFIDDLMEEIRNIEVSSDGNGGE